MAKSNMDQDILKVLLSEEEIKARVPVWKRESGPDGDVWVDPGGMRPKPESC